MEDLNWQGTKNGDVASGLYRENRRFKIVYYILHRFAVCWQFLFQTIGYFTWLYLRTHRKFFNRVHVISHPINRVSPCFLNSSISITSSLHYSLRLQTLNNPFPFRFNNFVLLFKCFITRFYGLCHLFGLMPTPWIEQSVQDQKVTLIK